MTENEQLQYLLQYLLKENSAYSTLKIPDAPEERKRLLRSLMNMRPPAPAEQEFLAVQDAYLTGESLRKGIVSPDDLRPLEPGLRLWQGDITTLRADAIVNAANSALLGCFTPCHNCIDNAIHSAAGVQLRLTCHNIMQRQGGKEPAGRAKITSAYNLPCRWVLHTVGPIISGTPTKEDRLLLSSCYRSCLELADAHHLQNIAFCCISTGEYHFPREEAARIAVRTVKEYRRETGSNIEVIFNVFQNRDYDIYLSLLGKHTAAE